MILLNEIEYTTVELPKSQKPSVPVGLHDKTFIERKDKILRSMREKGFDTLLIYGDREHGANFGYLTGIEPRFEEAVYVLHQDGKAYLLLGNESLYMPSVSRTDVIGIHVPHFSLPNQPMEPDKSLTELFLEAGITNGTTVGLVGWKLFTSKLEDNSLLFDIPHFIVKAVQSIVRKDGKVINATDIFIHPEYGVRVLMNTNEIAYFEFGAALGSSCMLEMIKNLDIEQREMDLAEYLAAYGQQTTVQTICATGERFTKGIVEPRNKKTKMGDQFSATVGYRGGLTVRKGYIAKNKEDLPDIDKEYVNAIVKPYFAAAASWYEKVGIDVDGGSIYELIEKIIPKSEFGWHLNPGHLIASEEWLSSPIFEASPITIKSGMMLQMDIIIKVPGHASINAEDGIAVADETMRMELANDYPEVWKRIQIRRNYMENCLGIKLKPEILPLSDTEGWLCPLLLAKDKAMVVKRGNN